MQIFYNFVLCIQIKISFLMDDNFLKDESRHLLSISNITSFIFEFLSYIYIYFRNTIPRKTDLKHGEHTILTSPCLTLSRCENIPSQIFSTRRHHVRPSGAGAEAEQRDTALQLLEHAILPVGSRVRAVRL